MIYDDRCFYCENRETYIEPEVEKAKVFYLNYDAAWRFGCGAYYNPAMLNKWDSEIYPYDCMKRESMIL